MDGRETMGCGSSSGVVVVADDGNNVVAATAKQGNQSHDDDDEFNQLLQEFSKEDDDSKKQKKRMDDDHLMMSSEPGTGFHEMLVTAAKASADKFIQNVGDVVSKRKLAITGSAGNDKSPSKDGNDMDDVGGGSPLFMRLRNVCAAPIFNNSQTDWKSFRPPYYEKTNDEIQFLKQSLKNNFCFSTLSSTELHTIIMAFQETHVYKKDSIIIKQGEINADYFYVIKSGVVHYEVNGKKLELEQHQQATKGMSFGELSLLYTCPRSASVIVDSDEGCIFYKVDQKTFRYILQMQTIQNNQTKLELLENVPFIKTQQLDQLDIQKLIQNLQPRKFTKGEYLVKKGSKGDYFFVIQKGKIEVSDISIGQTTYENQILGVGDFFGERSLITHELRSANCIAITDGIVLTIAKSTFELTIGKYSKLVLKSQDKRQLVSIFSHFGMLSFDWTDILHGV